jgi:hypothetical protein
MTDYSYIGAGKIYVREYGAAAGRIAIGNCSRLSLGVTEDIKELIDHTQAGGGTYNEVRRVSAVEATITVHDLSPENLARVLFGASNTVAAGSVTDEAAVGYHGALTVFEKLPSGSIVVKHTSGTPTYTAGTDYDESPGGIIVLSTGAITDGQDLKVSYAHGAQYRIETLINAAKDYEVYFEGLNEARSAKKFSARIHRMKIGAVKELGLIADEHAGLEFSGKLTKNTNITTAGLSQYVRFDEVA